MSGSEWSIYFERRSTGQIEEQHCYGRFGQTDFCDAYHCPADRRRAIRAKISEALAIPIEDVHLSQQMMPILTFDEIPAKDRIRDIAHTVWAVYSVHDAGDESTRGRRLTGRLP